ncbi:hypothetical protein C8Q78DRAFT_1081771 [Trametes maxima]|nr:hypothetical protein C8Q78DRAFT_1081771 [Trametes maxima]
MFETVSDMLICPQPKVAALVLVNLFHTILAVHASYFFLVENYFNPARLLTASWSLNVHPVIVGTVIVACQTFFACRVYLLGKQFRALVFVAGVMLIAEYGFSIGLITVFFSLVCFVTALAAPQDLIFVAADLVCTKVYVNSVLAALNLREIRPKRVKGEPISDAIDLAIRPRHESVVNITKDWPPSSSTTGGSTIDIKVADNIVAGV